MLRFSSWLSYYKCSTIFFFWGRSTIAWNSHIQKKYIHPFLPAWRHFTTQNLRFFWSANGRFVLSSGHQVDHFKGMRLRLGLGWHDGDESWILHGRKKTMFLFWLVATQIFFIFIPDFGEDEPILTSIFFKGVETTNQFFIDDFTQLVVNWWFGAWWFGIPRVPFTNNPFLNQVGDFYKVADLSPKNVFRSVPPQMVPSRI